MARTALTRARAEGAERGVAWGVGSARTQADRRLAGWQVQRQEREVASQRQWLDERGACPPTCLLTTPARRWRHVWAD